MRRVVYHSYTCEVCGTRYETAEQARACEGASRPVARFDAGAPVRLVPHLAPEALREERFVVESSLITPYRPARTEVSPAHVVSYVLQNHLGRVSFIPEYQLQPDGEGAHAANPTDGEEVLG